MTEIRAILFDFGGTLDVAENWLDRFWRGYRAAGLELARQELDRAYSTAGIRTAAVGEAIRGYGLSQLVRFLVGEQLVALLREGPESVRRRLARASGDSLDAIIEEITSAFVAESAAGLARSREVLAKLAPRFTLGVVSNWYGNLDVVLGEAGLAPYFEVVLDSVRVGLSKPDPRIFQRAIAALKMAPEAIAMVGDSPEKDCAPAMGLKMRAILLRGAGLTPPGPQPDLEIRALEELLELRL